MSDTVLVALITSIPATITALATWRQAHPRPPPAPPGQPAEDPPPPATQRSVLPVVLTAVVGLVVVVLVALVTASALDDENGGGGDVAETLDVPGTRQWTDTGIDVEQGDRVTITATGVVVHATTTNGQSGPDGDPGKRFPSNVLATSDHGSLLGRIGADGAPFHVGTTADFVASADGRFFLGVNDVGVDNNSGAFRADVRVRRAE